ncbi:hypothetical protein [Mycobacterium sp. shizuoka-1]|uniref:hypothetical protein n=1 Tax=Mycobacterium sp. shizuoka-1 TaxID=2039281 RepID=UPI000C067BB8|nr:hypothetical protein [Mycobacterium sp. shizuoka-1]GAY14159.1 hypothetical protein MSZK_08850 [Mycobacterium sp. shizuoka-1]
MTATNATDAHPDKAPRARLWVNWLLALSTILGAAAVQLFAMGAVMSTAACSAASCPKPTGFVYGLLTYGAPVIAVAAIVLSFFTARHRRGFLVPLVAWLLLILDVAILAVTFS